MAEINLHPVFQTWRSEDDFLGLLCLIIILASEDFLGGPYAHRIPIAQFCRGHLIQMSQKAIQEQPSIQAERERNDKLEAAQNLLGLATARTFEVESLVALRHVFGVDPVAILFGRAVDLINIKPSKSDFVSTGVQIGVMADGVSAYQGWPVVAFIAPQRGTPFMAPIMLALFDETIRRWRTVAKPGTTLAAMAHIQPAPPFSEAQNVEDILALVSLGLLQAAEQQLFGPVDHKIPLVPWCRGHLALLTKRALIKGKEVVRSSQLQQGHEQRAQEDTEPHRPSTSHTDGDRVPAGRASAAPSSAMLLYRNFQLANAQKRHTEQMFVWLSQNDQARQDMLILARDGKIDSQQYRDLQAAVGDREKQMIQCVASGMFVLNDATHDINKKLIELMNRT